MADVTPVIKKEDRNLVKSYRSVSVLPAISKISKIFPKKKKERKMVSFISLWL